MKDKKTIEINAQFLHALERAREGFAPLFITGRAGTGKSTLLNFLRRELSTEKQIAVLAPTGVAALNVEGDTIHSFFRFAPSDSVTEALENAKDAIKRKRDKIYKKLDLLIIDEISMVRADMLDSIDVFLRHVRANDGPFGGIRVIFFGDLYQLPPVLKTEERDHFHAVYEHPYFFASAVIERLFTEKIGLDFIELEKIYRQTDGDFIKLLNSIRTKEISDADFLALSERVGHSPDETVLRLTATNARASMINEDSLAKLKGVSHSFRANKVGEFGRDMHPAPETLTLKVGARVMTVVNATDDAYYNGSLGTVRGFFEINDDELDLEDFDFDTAREGVRVELDSGETVDIGPHSWDISRTVFDYELGNLKRESVGSYRQIPLILAYAMTIHKSQGKTFERALIDLDRGAFAAGQTYVALSRLTSMQGLYLQNPLRPSDVRLDYRIVKFLTNLQYQKAKEEQSVDSIESLLEEAIANKSRLKMTYLKGKNIKSVREITPVSVEDGEYLGKTFVALNAYCHMRQGERVFNLGRILKLEEVE